MASETTSTPTVCASPGEVSQAALIATLPEAIQRALENYRVLAFVEAPEDAKEFQQHQAACKAALQHVETLMKLINAIDITSVGGNPSDEKAALLARAEAAVEAFVTGDTQHTEPEETHE